MGKMLAEVQVKILTKLMHSEEGLRYSQAYPGEEVEDDLYNYHLKFLITKGLVEKKENKYILTPDGRKEVQKINAVGQEEDFYFRVTVLMWVINKKGQLLLQKRTRYPLLGDINTPSGKVRPGEKFEEAAQRKLEEETGLYAKFKFVGGFRSIRVNPQGKIWEDTIYQICVAKNPKGELKERTEFGEFFWSTFEHYLEVQKTNKSGGKVQEEIIKRIRDGNSEPFYLEEKIVLEGY